MPFQPNTLIDDTSIYRTIIIKLQVKITIKFPVQNASYNTPDNTIPLLAVASKYR